MSSNFTDHEEDLLEIEKLRESAQQINLDDSFGDEEGEEEEDYSDELDEGIIESASKGHLTMSPTNQTASQSRIDEGQNILDNLSNLGDSTLNFNSSMPKKDHPKKVEAVAEDKEEIGHCSSDTGGNISPIKPSGPPRSTVENKATIQRPGQRGPPTRGRPGPPGLTRPGAPVKRPVMMPKRVSDSQIDDGQPLEDAIGGTSNQGDKDNQEDTSSNISEIRQRTNDDTVNSQFDLLRNLTDDLKTADERRIEGRTAVDRIDEDDDEHTLEGRDTDRSKKDKKKSIADHIKKETMMQDSADIFNEKELKFRNTKEDDSINLSPSKQGQILDGLDIEDKFEKIKGSDVGRLRDMEQFGQFGKQISIIPKSSEDSADYSPEIDNRRELGNMNQDNEKQNESDIWGNKLNDANDPAENEEPQSKLGITDLNISDSVELHTINPVSKGNSKFAPSKQKLPQQKRIPVTIPPVRARVPPMPKKTAVEDVDVSEVIREAEAPFENKDLPIHDIPEAKLFVPSGLSPDDYKFDESPTVNLNRDYSPSNLFSSPERADSRASPNLSQPKGSLLIMKVTLDCHSQRT